MKLFSRYHSAISIVTSLGLCLHCFCAIQAFSSPQKKAAITDQVVTSYLQNDFSFRVESKGEQTPVRYIHTDVENSSLTNHVLLVDVSAVARLQGNTVEQRLLNLFLSSQRFSSDL